MKVSMPVKGTVSWEWPGRAGLGLVPKAGTLRCIGFKDGESLYHFSAMPCSKLDQLMGTAKLNSWDRAGLKKTQWQSINVSSNSN